MTRRLATTASVAVAVVIGYHAVRRRHELRTLTWALTGHPADEADPTCCNGDEVVEWIRLHDIAKRTRRIP